MASFTISKSRTKQVHIPESYHHLLKLLANHRQESLQAVVGEALQHYLADYITELRELAEALQTEPPAE